MPDSHNDGDLDIYVTNGHVIDNVALYHPHLSYRQKDLLYENLGGRFRDVSSSSGPAFQIEHVGRGAAVGDYDNDGDLDIVVSDCGGRPILLRNDGGNRNHWLALRARGRESNRFGLGTRVRVTRRGRVGQLTTPFRDEQRAGSTPRDLERGELPQRERHAAPRRPRTRDPCASGDRVAERQDTGPPRRGRRPGPDCGRSRRPALKSGRPRARP